MFVFIGGLLLSTLKEVLVYVIYPSCYEAEPGNPKGNIYTTASEGSM